MPEVFTKCLMCARPVGFCGWNLCTLRGHGDCIELIAIAPSHGMVFVKWVQANPLPSSNWMSLEGLVLLCAFSAWANHPDLKLEALHCYDQGCLMLTYTSSWEPISHVSLPNSMYSDVMLVAWNQSLWGSLHNGNGQKLQIRASPLPLPLFWEASC